jgi:hypothetical protein
MSAEEVLSEVLAEEAEKAKDLLRRHMAAVGPYLMPEVQRAQGWENCEVPDVAEFNKGLHLRSFMKGREWRIAAMFEDIWWDGTLVTSNLHVTNLRAQPAWTPGPRAERGGREEEGEGGGEARGKGGRSRVSFSARSWGYSAFQSLPDGTSCPASG